MAELLAIDKLRAGYGEAVVLSDISLDLAEGQSLALLGRNGMGKTTLINSIVGVTRYRSGTISLAGRDITRLPPEQRAHAGVGWVPQERNIFKSLTVRREPHRGGAARGRGRRSGSTPCSRASPSASRTSATSSPGGEQQMLAVGRALVLNPKIVLLDEPLEGLAPIIVEELLAALTRLIRDEGMSAILVEQSPQKILGVTDRAVILERGMVVHVSTSAALKADQGALETYLGVTDQSPRRGHAR